MGPEPVRVGNLIQGMSAMSKPAELDDCHIRTALTAAALSPCRSKRGVALFDPRTGAHRGSGHNGPPAYQPCPGRAICSGTCGQRSVHAEVRALRDAMLVWIPNYGGGEPGALDLVHVELATNGGVVACSGPSCWQCSREILDVEFVGGVWLYESTPEENCPHSFWQRRVDCQYCQGWRCSECDGDSERCDHDVLERHGDIQIVEAHWRRYTASEFNRATLKRCGIAQ